MELLLDTVPDEIWEKILAHFIRDRDTLQAVIGTAYPAHNQALRLYWQNETCEKGLLEELEDHQPDTQQQSLADFIRNVVTDFRHPMPTTRLGVCSSLVCRVLLFSMARLNFVERPVLLLESHALSEIASVTWRLVIRSMDALIFFLSSKTSCRSSVNAKAFSR